MSYASTRALGASASDVLTATAASLPGIPGVPTLPTFAWQPPQLPFNPADYDPRTFAANQAKRWADQAMQQGIEQGRAQLSSMLKITLPKLPSMPGSEIGDWSVSYVQEHGVPTTPEAGAKMVMSLAHAQAQRLGVPPEWIAAADIMMHPPTSVAEGVAMVANVGKAYFDKYGAPLLQAELMNLSANLSMVTQAIPVQFAVAGFDALKDGKLSGEEIAGIAAQAAAYACGLILQGIGIPAPLGALLSGVIAQGFAKVADDVIHADDAQMRAQKAAYDAAAALRTTLMAQCAKQAQQTWNKTQEFWDQVLLPVQSLLDVPDVAARLQASGGIRYYGRNVITLPAGITLPSPLGPGDYAKYREAGDWDALAAAAEQKAKYLESVAVAKKGTPLALAAQTAATLARKDATAATAKAAAQKKLPLYQYGFDCVWWEGTGTFVGQDNRYMLPQNARPYPDGCLYYGRVEPNGSYAEAQQFNASSWTQRPYWADPANVWQRCGSRFYEYATFWSPDSAAHCADSLKLASQFGYDNSRFANPAQMVIRVTPYTDHTTPVRTKVVTIATGSLVDGRPSAQAALQFWGATRPATPYSSYSSTADASDNSQWKAFSYIDPSSIVVSAGSAHLDVPFNYCDTAPWVAALQTASAAAATVQQDIIRTVAWQVGSEQAQKLAADLKAKQLKDAADMIAYAKAVQSKNAKEAAEMIAYAKAVQAQKSAQLVAQQATKARLQASALAAARTASASYRAAAQARVNGGLVSGIGGITTAGWLAVSGLVLGAYLLYRTSHKRSSQR